MRKIIGNIIFTRNRPLQLDAYLESLYRCFPAELIHTYVLYKPGLFEQEYEKLFAARTNCTVINESDFFSDFLRLLGEINTKYVLFGVDDVVYFDSVDFNVIDECFNRFEKDIFGFSLRFGEANIRNGGDHVREVAMRGQVVYCIDWTEGQTPTTRYPFELCATIYPTMLVKEIIGSARNNNSLVEKMFSPGSFLIKPLGTIVSTRSILKAFGYFFNPNTLESWNCRWCQKHRAHLPAFLYFQNHCASVVQVNMVNTSTVNETNGSAEYTVESLAEKYRHGYRLDIDLIVENRPMGTHSGKEHFKLVKTV